MFHIIRAIHFLHTEKSDTEISDNFILFHCDIKSANICLRRDYTAKLIDCGLAKFVPVDDSIAILFSVQNTTLGGVFRTPGYICTRYSHEKKTFKACYYVYLFGIFMIELVTGCIQNGQKGDFFKRYFPENFDGNPAEALKLAIPELAKDVDPLADEWEDGSLSSVCSLAIRCIQYRFGNRPTTSELVEKLGELVCQTYHNVGGGPIESCGGKMGTLSLNKSNKQRHVCSKVSTFVSMCKDHSTCQQCFEDHVITHLGDETIQCPIKGCDQSFSNKECSRARSCPEICMFFM